MKPILCDLSLNSLHVNKAIIRRFILILNIREDDICRAIDGEQNDVSDIAELLLKYAGDLDSVSTHGK